VAEFDLGQTPEYIRTCSEFEESAIAWTPVARRQMSALGQFSVDIVHLLKTRVNFSFNLARGGEVVVIKGSTLDELELRITAWLCPDSPFIKVISIEAI
jgi:hypothetical protein